MSSSSAWYAGRLPVRVPTCRRTAAVRVARRARSWSTDEVFGHSPNGGRRVHLETDARRLTRRYGRAVTLSSPTRTEAFVALVCGVWAVVALAPEGWSVVPLAAGYALAALLAGPRPGLAGATFALVSLVGALADVPSDSPAALAAGFAVLFAAGRYAGTRTGLLVLAVNVLVVGLLDEPSPENLLFGAFLLGSVYCFGVLVRRRTAGARRAAAELSALAAEDPTARAAETVAHERTRLAGDALTIVGTAVGRMRAAAERAEHGLDPEALAEVRDSGREAVTELRRLLGLLRGPSAPSVESSGPERPRSWLRRAALTVASLLALAVLETGQDLTAQNPRSIALSLIVVIGAALRSRDPVIGCAVASGALALGLVADIPLVYGVWDTAACALLMWSAAADGRARAVASAATVAVLTLVDVHRHIPGNEAFMIGVLAISAVAGHLWAERERDERASLQRAADLLSDREAIAAEAVRAERLRMARELHDVVSHAIGVMVLQAGAAEALRDTDPEGARAAVRTIQTTGARATSELQVLLGLVDPRPTGTRAPREPADADMVALVDRMRASGLTIQLHGDGFPADDTVKVAAYRVVQEALTNAARHAPGAVVTIRTRSEAGWLSVEVENGPARIPVATSSAEADAGGYGLVGLAERVRALGGELAAGPSHRGGFAVAARLPLSREAVRP
jgi:signal transduction histidine kinase